MANAADRQKSANPNLGKSVPVSIGKTAAEGKAAGDSANAAFKTQLNNQFERALPKPTSTD